MITIDQQGIVHMLNELNPQQQQAAKAIYGPVLVLAGAGSGKTRVLTVRTANMLSQGIQAKNMMIATFTNKAAREMKERIEQAVGEETVKDLWMGTFHSLCVRMLRKHGHLLGYEQDESSKRCKFVIYDTGDTLNVVERIYKQMNIEDKYKPGYALHYIDNAKNNLWDPEYCSYHVAESSSEQVMAQVYMRYQEQLRMMNAMDFGDLIMNTVVMLRDYQEARDYWQSKFHYISSDEFQDVNYAQLQLLLLLSAPQYNIFSVGDVDQSIFGFRGSDVRIISSFDQMFSNGQVLKLENNYRSVANIVESANYLISNNPQPYDKVSRTTKESGETIKVISTGNEYQEAAFIAATIKKKVIQEELKYDDFAILYRGNAQSRVIEDFFRNQFIPYKVMGGSGFYDREEIKDIISYLRAIFNRKDDTAILRILNKPSRGIGKTSQEKIEEYATNNKVSVHRALKNVSDIPSINKRSATKITAFFDLLDHFQKKLDSGIMLTTFVRYILEQTGLWAHYEKDKKADEKIDNLKEFLVLIDKYETENPEKTLEDFLQEISLVTDSGEKHQTDAVKMMTMHSSKGLEFPYVFLIGWNEGVFPSWRSSDPKDIEEERRLAYVGITRAEKELFITHSEQRTQMDGKTRVFKPSRFISELPEELLENTSISL